MDDFTKTVRPQKIYLDGLDKIISGANIAFYYWYENKERRPWNAFMPAATLEQAFYKTLCEFPFFAGTLTTDSNGMVYVQVSKDNLNTPVYTDSACDVDFGTIRDDGFNTKLLGRDFDHARDVPAPARIIGNGKIKLAEIHVMRLQGNSGVCVFVSVAHCLVDGQGYTAFMRRWAEINRWLLACNEGGKEFLPERQYIHDRLFLSEFWNAETDRIESAISSYTEKNSTVSKWIAWLSPETRGRIIKAMISINKRINCYFYISQDKVSKLCSDIKENATKGQRLSTNDILTATTAFLIVKSMRIVDIEAQAKPIPTIMRYIFGKKTEEQRGALVSVAASLRPRVAHPDVLDYTGNMMIARHIPVPLDLVVADPVSSALAKVSGYIRSAVNNTDAEYICQLGHLANRKPEDYVQILQGLLGYKYNLMVSNQALFNHYDVDFGMDIPALVRPALLSFPNLVLIMPCHLGVGKGYEIAMTLTTEVAAKVIKDEHWMSLVDRCDYDV
ncbi:hypothetical protein H4S06_000156 [Coemansia sp. BCRC 34490]|nr:hypothetical protein H4S06_000156 [Coemansia sp. BCRC 34490]